MKLPDNLKIKIDADLFSKYMLNENHFMGKYRSESFKQINITNSNCEDFIEGLKRVPSEQNYLHIDVIYKLGFIYRIEFITSMAVENKKFYLKTIWLHKEKTRDIELLNLIII